MGAVVDGLGGLGPHLAHIEADLSAADAPPRVIEHARTQFGAVDALIANHAHSCDGGLEAVTAAELDLAWAVNARAVVLLVQAFAAATTTHAAPGASSCSPRGSTWRRWPGSWPTRSARAPCTR